MPEPADALFFSLARLYGNVHYLCYERLRFKVRGLGYLLRHIKRERLFKVQGHRMFFNPKCAGAYGRLVGGRWNEPETHFFLRNVIPAVEGEIDFVDVGASIGEMMVDVAAYDKVKTVHAIEPIPECAVALRETARANDWTKVRVHEMALAERECEATFQIDAGNPHVSTLSTAKAGSAVKVHCGTLDQFANDVAAPVIVLIDVEGAEVKVFQGAMQFISKHRPLIVFEFNRFTRRTLALTDVRDLLGESYSIYRLRRDGLLDLDVGTAWNCVAVPNHTQFHAICSRLLAPPARA